MCISNVGVVALCNAALDHVGENETVLTSLDEDRLAAKLCRRRYPAVRDALLQLHPWNFAQKRVALSADETPPAYGFAYAYSLPSDCLQIEMLAAEEPWQAGHAWQVEGGKILTDLTPPLSLRYIARIEDPSCYPPLFRELLALRLAAELAQPLAQSSRLGQDLEQRFANMMALARNRDAQESQAPDHAFSPWLAARF